MVVTGGGIEDVNIVKKAWVWPWQKVRFPWESTQVFTLSDATKGLHDIHQSVRLRNYPSGNDYREIAI